VFAEEKLYEIVARLKHLSEKFLRDLAWEMMISWFVLKIQVFWNVMLCCWADSSRNFEES
jgi:hypothetical protein